MFAMFTVPLVARHPRPTGFIVGVGTFLPLCRFSLESLVRAMRVKLLSLMIVAPTLTQVCRVRNHAHHHWKGRSLRGGVAARTIAVGHILPAITRQGEGRSRGGGRTGMGAHVRRIDGRASGTRWAGRLTRRGRSTLRNYLYTT